MTRVRVVEAWQASYVDPIAVAKGDRMTLTARTEKWDGHLWIWARCDDGREGWVPNTLAEAAGDGHVASRDYTAQELTCAAGQVLTAIERSHGWVFCEDAALNRGWVPDRNLGLLDVQVGRP